ncbi:MAG: nitroreductase family protein [Bacteroidales bacterium]|nr:nitroreductase family protein [Bacteroidales bacterium]
MEFSELIRVRQSDRKYLPQEVEEEKIVKCLEAARLAPSANNSQPWKFIVVNEPELKDKVAALAAGLGMNKWAVQAPAIIAVVLETPGFTTRLGGLLKGKEFRLMDIGMAVEHLCLQAADLGLGTCIMGWFDERKVKRTLGIPRSRRVPLLISLGYPDTQTRRKIRKSIKEVTSWNSY